MSSPPPFPVTSHYPPPSGQPYAQPAGQPYPPHSGQPYAPPAGQPYAPPAGQSYPPPAGQPYPPIDTQPGSYAPPLYPQPLGYPQPGYPQPGYAPQQPGALQQGYGQHQGGYQPPAGFSDPNMSAYQAGWMHLPPGIPQTTPGLEYLAMIDQLLVHQKVELLEAFTGFETQNKFTIKNSMGQKVYYALEDSDCLTRNCCGPLRPFDMKILDNYKNEVIHLHRPLACDSCCFPCCLQTMEVSAPPGTIIGTIEQRWSLCYPQFDIKNAAGDCVLKIEGPLCRFTICGEVDFRVMALDGVTQVGKISKQWAGLMREAFTDADYFGITFPMDLDVKMKAVMLGACFLIDAMFFEKSGNRESDRPGML